MTQGRSRKARKKLRPDVLVEDERHRHAEYELEHNGHYGEHASVVQR